MSKKMFKKKKAYQEMCREQAMKGNCNNHQGQFVKAVTGSRMHDMMLAGYKVR